ncbi:hypothetical protein PHYPSEUDO_012482 [Phytophthora pseudosyringae]|uniref:Uncharacterized protein n=1 Tax=Phytophthora pseudosyringae TaxID=221518 RepID=A0A8T1WIC0_9STRA|nr:hypothetical protein PHYPSEUDO_012482 [Phytophthora pseudosyringae]
MADSVKPAKKKSIFWDKDGVDGGKSSVDVVIDWMTTEANYNRWRGSDHNNGNTKEALLKESVAALKSVGIEHRSPAQIREKIGNIEEKYHVAEVFFVSNGYRDL